MGSAFYGTTRSLTADARDTIRLGSLLLMLAVALLTTGCASTFTSRVSVFHQLPEAAAQGEDRTYQLRFAAAEPDSLEHRTYRTQLAEALKAQGFREASPARYAITFDYGVTTQQRTFVRPQPAVYPSFSLGYGFWGARSGLSLGLGWPGYYWGPSWVNVRQAETVQEHRLKIDIATAAGAGASAGTSVGKVYEGSALADAYAADMPTVFPLLVRALLQDFPGRSGESRTVRIETPSR